jgi:hypothetical protein
LERAAQFLCLQCTDFGGKVAGRCLVVSATTPARFGITKLGPILEDVHSGLAGVVIECVPWHGFIERYDRDDALIYLDPLYYGSEQGYDTGLFERADFETMAELLGGIAGRFVLSINDHTETRRIAKRLVPSTEGQLTLVSMNVRNFSNVGRGPKDVAALVDFLDEADVIVLQEVGLGHLLKDPATELQQHILDSIVAQLRIHFGSEWTVDIADGASGSGAGRETSLIAYPKKLAGNELSASWVEFFDLGPKRDMAVWQLNATKGAIRRRRS